MGWLSQLTTATLFLASFSLHKTPEAPKADKESITEVRFNTKIQDPYRWMENSDDNRLAEWIEAQNNHTIDYLEKSKLAELIKELEPNIKKYELPSSEHKQVLNLIKNRFRYLNHSPYQFFSRTFSQDKQLWKSPSGRYQISTHSPTGSDLKQLEIIDSRTETRLSDIINVKFAQVYWMPDEKGFLYITDRDGRMGHTSAAIFYHRLGQTQPNDKLIYKANSPRTGISLTPYKDQWLLWTEDDNTTSIFEFEIKNSRSPSDISGHITRTIIEDVTGELTPFQFVNNYLYLIDYRKHAMGHVVALNLLDGQFQDIVEATELSLIDAIHTDKSIFLNYIENTSSKLMHYDHNTKKLSHINLPHVGSVILLSDIEDGLRFALSSYIEPISIWDYDIKTNKIKLVYKLPGPSIKLSATRVFYKAHNKKSVPIWIVSQADVSLTKNTPMILRGYGGFRISPLPFYNPRNTPWYKRGGAIAYVTLPGGLEYGEDWHKAGSLLNKTNVFKDFAAAARHLTSKKLTSTKKLIASGGSNGGLLVGAMITQYPQLFKAAVPEMGVLDMLRYPQYTAGKWWVSEYGDPNDAKQFKNLLSLSPYHNLKQKNYPSTLVLTADADDRVVPAHSYKFAAKLQATGKGSGAKLLYTEKWGSHNSSGSIDEYIKYQAVRLAFMMNEVNM